jgi:DNA processing protein
LGGFSYPELTLTTLVLAEGILHFRVKRDLEDLLDTKNSLVISEFPPRLGWIARNAMQRNRTICGLSDVVIAVESGMTGGTFAAGQTALELMRPFFVVDYPTPMPSAAGNRYFLGNGARALTIREDGSLVNLMDVFDAIEDQEAPPAESRATQLSLDVG